MKNKKLFIMVSFAVIAAMPVAIITSQHSSNNTFSIATNKPAEVDCDYYFNNLNGYTSIHDLNVGAINGTLDGNYLTWGTVTSHWYNGNGDLQTYIQSRDANGYNAAIRLNNVGITELAYPVGSVIELTASAANIAYVDGEPQITAVSNISRAYDENRFPVLSYEMPSGDWPWRLDFDNPTYIAYKEAGCRQISMQDVNIVYLDGYYAEIRYQNDVWASISFSDLDATTKDAIHDIFAAYLNAPATLNLTGYMGFDQNPLNLGRMELRLKSVEEVDNEPGLQRIVVNTAPYQYTKGDELLKPTSITAYITDGTSFDLSAEQLATVQCTGYDDSDYGYQFITASFTHEGFTAYYTYRIIVNDTNGNFKVTVNSDTLFRNIDEGYSTGNYGNVNGEGGITYEYYRAKPVWDEGERRSTFRLLPLTHDYGETLGGSFSNHNDLYNLKEIDMTYFTSESSGTNKAKLHYGRDSYTGSREINYSLAETTVAIDGLDDVGYFKLESGDCDLDIVSMTLIFHPEDGYDFNASPMGANQYRTAPLYDSERLLTAGTTTVTVPMNRAGTIEKTYTYYTYDYVVNNFELHPEYVAAAALTDPVDVANYYSVFKQFPANYVYSSNYNAAYEYFGANTRIVSTYSRTDGYMQYVPYATFGNTNLPRYHEFDIALEPTYSVSNRFVGRLVAVESGLRTPEYGYGAYPVCYFTDDHYATFQEFDNYGGFLPRFNIQRQVTNYCWSEITNGVDLYKTGYLGYLDFEKETTTTKPVANQINGNGSLNLTFNHSSIIDKSSFREFAIAKNGGFITLTAPDGYNIQSIELKQYGSHYENLTFFAGTDDQGVELTKHALVTGGNSIYNIAVNGSSVYIKDVSADYDVTLYYVYVILQPAA